MISEKGDVEAATCSMESVWRPEVLGSLTLEWKIEARTFFGWYDLRHWGKHSMAGELFSLFCWEVRGEVDGGRELEECVGVNKEI